MESYIEIPSFVVRFDKGFLVASDEYEIITVKG